MKFQESIMFNDANYTISYSNKRKGSVYRCKNCNKFWKPTKRIKVNNKNILVCTNCLIPSRKSHQI